MNRKGILPQYKGLGQDLRPNSSLEQRQSLLNEVSQDFKYGLRMLLRYPGFTIVAIITLGLGIGANCAMFTVINAVLLRPLPYADPDRLAIIYTTNASRGITKGPISGLDFADYRDQNQVFQDVTGSWQDDFNISEVGQPELVQGSLVTANYFSALGVKMLLGRQFLPDEGQPGGNRAVILSYPLWQRHFGGDFWIVGRPLVLNGGSFTVAGVAPPSFSPPNTGDEVWIPIILDGTDLLRKPSPLPAAEMTNRRRRFLTMLGRLKPGVTIGDARAQLKVIADQLDHQYPASNQGYSVDVIPLYDEVITNVKLSLLVLLGAVAFVLLIACANVASLQFARTASRAREITVRTALGASRGRLVRQLMTETFLLALLGGGLGLIITIVSLNALLSASPASLPRASEVTIDGRVLVFTLAVSIFTGFIFGIAPTVRASTPHLHDLLKEGGRSLSGGFSHRIRSVLIICEIALAITLLIGATLLIRTFLHYQEVSPGFNSGNLLTMRLSLSQSTYSSDKLRADFFSQSLMALRSIPSVTSAAAINYLPLGGGNAIFRFAVAGRPPSATGEVLTANYRAVSSDYFQTMEIPVLEGREFSDMDSDTAPGTIIINDTMARMYFANEDPVGKHLTISYGDASPREIVGVVGDVKHSALDTESGCEMYVPYRQTPWAAMSLIVRTRAEPATIQRAAVSRIQELDPGQPVARVLPMQDVLSNSISQHRFSMILLAAFAGLALILAAVGIYGVISYSVSQRLQEITVRIAVGAQPRDVMKLIVGEALVLSLIGTAAGLIVAAIVSRGLSRLLFEVNALDPASYLCVPLILGLVALSAAYIPARRALRISPAQMLR